MSNSPEAFVASVDAWVRKTKARQTAVVRGSTQEVIRRAQTTVAEGGNMPVDTGFLRNSLVSTLLGGSSLSGSGSYTAAIAGMEAGDIAQFAWTAPYARRIEYGFTGADSLGRNYNQPGRFFVRQAIAGWQQIVDAEAVKARAAVNG